MRSNDSDHRDPAPESGMGGAADFGAHGGHPASSSEAARERRPSLSERQATPRSNGAGTAIRTTEGPSGASAPVRIDVSHRLVKLANTTRQPWWYSDPGARGYSRRGRCSCRSSCRRRGNTASGLRRLGTVRYYSCRFCSPVIILKGTVLMHGLSSGVIPPN